MENRLGNSNGVGISKKSRSLDLKTLYKSSISKDSVNKSLKRKNRSGNDADRLKQDKRSRKVVSLSSFKKVDSESEKILDKACNGTTILHNLEDSKVGLDEKLCDSSGPQGISVGLAGSMIYVPRRRRDFVGRSRFENGLVQKSAGESDSQEELVDKIPKEPGEESSAQDQLCKAEEKDSGKEIKESNSAAQLQLENGHSNQSPVKDDQLVAKQTNCNSRKRKSSASNRRVGKEAKSSGDTSGRISKVSREDDEENLEANAARMLSSRFDPNCTQFPSNSVTPGSPSASKLHPLFSGKNSVNLRSELPSSKCVSDDTDDRLLRPRRKHDGEGKVRKRRHFYEISYSDVESHWLLNKKIKVFWPLDESWYHGFVDGYDGDKNLHHVKYDDRDEEWINLQGERFKILLFPTEIPGKNQRKRRSSGSKSTLKIKGDDTSTKDEEKQKGKLEDDSCMGDMESVPIITWLARSMHRDKSSTLKAVLKRKKSEIMTSNETVKVNGDVVRDSARHTDRSASSLASCGLPGPSSNESLSEKSSFRSGSIFPIVYYRKRLHTEKKGTYKGSVDNNVEDLKQLHVSKIPDPDVEFLPIEDSGFLELYSPWNVTEQFELSLSLQLISLMKYFLMADVDWLSRVYLLLHHGTLVTLWPRVRLEMIFLNNHDGLRYLIFEGCLMEVVQLIFRILMVVDHSNKQGAEGANADLQLPVFSIGLQVSCIPGFQRHAFQFYSFHEMKHSKCLYLEQNVKRHSLLVKQVSIAECTHDSMKVLQKVMQKRSRHGISSGLVSRVLPSVNACPTSVCYKKQNTSSFTLPFTAQPPTLLLSLHLQMIRELGHDPAEFMGTNHNLVTAGGCDMVDCTTEHSEPSLKSNRQNDGPIITSLKGQEAQESKDLHAPSQRQQLGSDSENLMSFSSSVDRHKHETRSNVPVNGISIQVPVSDRFEDGTPQSSNLALNIQDSGTSSPKATAPRSMWHRSKSSLNGHLSHGWTDSKGDFLNTNLANGPKKRRTQVSYSLPSGGSDSKNKGSLQKGLPNKRIRRSAADVSRGLQKDLESSFCDANVLVTLGDRGWREYGAQVFLEPFDNNEWKLAVKISGTTKYSHRAHQFLQPGSTNRFTHAMMWKGGKDWTLEFPDRGQWSLFKEMHEECYNRNSRAALVRNIPIPGIRMIGKDNFDGTETEFIRSSSKYFQQTETDVEMALDPSRVLYDMDSDDEQCLLRIRECSDAESSGSFEITDDMFEKAMDMFEKASYVKQRDHFTLIEIQELMAGVGYLESTETIYEHWRTKRQRKGMPLIRHLQPPLWEKYQRELKDWELVMSKANTPNSCGSQKKQSPIEKPAMFAFCFKPRGLEVKHRGTKHRSQKKLSVYTQHSSAALGDYDVYSSSGRRPVGFASGDERFLYSNQSYEHLNEFPTHPVFPGTYSPCDLGMGYFSAGGNGHHRNHQNKSQRINGKRNTSERWDAGCSEWPSSNLLCYSNGSQRLDPEELQHSTDIDEYKLRDAAGAARRACALAKLKRERAESLRYRADLAIQKAAAALMCAEAVKASSVDQSSSEGLESSSEG
ncbi:putative sister chromatid cohesion protein PDS5 [Cardamine amara subsp. amara]|uniref:Enhancer of polycomb-like protein n=1 Tax=Cardamine amara subsp. amara TaxID=228776 RepID=A0ABD1AUB3_CARAN